MIAWRRDIHQNPELGNQEARTATLVAQHLRELGYEVREQIAVTGVVATLVGTAGLGPMVALRADTLRTMSEERRQFMRRRTNELAESIAHGMDAKARDLVVKT